MHASALVRADAPPAAVVGAGSAAAVGVGAGASTAVGWRAAEPTAAAVGAGAWAPSVHSLIPVVVAIVHRLQGVPCWGPAVRPFSTRHLQLYLL